MANQVLPGYLTPVSDKLYTIVDHYGPTSYANVSGSAGAGDVINASDLGIGGIEMILGAGVSASGNYFVVVYLSLAANNPDAVGSVQLRWFAYPASADVGAPGDEVANGTDLAAESVRLLIIGV